MRQRVKHDWRMSVDRESRRTFSNGTTRSQIPCSIIRDSGEDHIPIRVQLIVRRWVAGWEREAVQARGRRGWEDTSKKAEDHDQEENKYVRTYVTHRSRMYCSETANNNRCTRTSTRNQINMYSGANQTKSERQGVKLRKVGRWIDKESKSKQSHGTTRSQVPERKGNMK